MHLEGRFAGPLAFFKAEGLSTTRTPAAITAAAEDAAFFIHAPADEAALEAATEREDDALLDAVDGFEEDAAEIAVGLVGDEELLAEGAEFAAAGVADDGGGGVADLAVNEIHSGRQEFFDALTFLDHAARITTGPGFFAATVALKGLGDRIHRPRSHVRSLIIPDIATRMALEGARDEVLERA
jgi:hypothetical protein